MSHVLRGFKRVPDNYSKEHIFTLNCVAKDLQKISETLNMGFHEVYSIQYILFVVYLTYLCTLESNFLPFINCGNDCGNDCGSGSFSAKTAQNVIRKNSKMFLLANIQKLGSQNNKYITAFLIFSCITFCIIFGVVRVDFGRSL